MVNSVSTMAHLTQPASLARAMDLKGLTPRSKVKTSPEGVPPLLRGTLALPGAPNEADRLLGKLSGALEALKANPDEMDALRLRVRDGPARELQKKLKAKEEKIQELERELKNARAAQGTHSGAGADAIHTRRSLLSGSRESGSVSASGRRPLDRKERGSSGVRTLRGGRAGRGAARRDGIYAAEDASRGGRLASRPPLTLRAQPSWSPPSPKRRSLSSRRSRRSRRSVRGRRPTPSNGRLGARW